MSAEPIHLIGLPKKHKLTADHLEDIELTSPADFESLIYQAAKWKNLREFWTRLAFITQFGTGGDDRTGGSGYLVVNWDFYFVIGTGTTINSYFERMLGLPWVGMAFKQEWEVGVNIRTNTGYAQRCFLWGNNSMVLYDHVYTAGNGNYAGFWLVRDATYASRILAVTRVTSTATITDCGGFSLYDRIKLRVELLASNLQKFYVNNVLKATHTTPVLNFTSGGLYGKLGISNQATNDESVVFYFARGRCDY